MEGSTRIALPVSPPYAPPRDAFRTILTFVARMSQMAWDACARVLLVTACTGGAHGAGYACDTGGTRAVRKAYEPA